MYFLIAISPKKCMSFAKNDIWLRCGDSEKTEVFTL